MAESEHLAAGGNASLETILNENKKLRGEIKDLKLQLQEVISTRDQLSMQLEETRKDRDAQIQCFKKELEGKENTERQHLAMINDLKRQLENYEHTLSSAGDLKLDRFPREVLARVIHWLPIAQWPSLERVSRHFRDAAHIAWNSLRKVTVDEDLVTQKELKENGEEMHNLVLDKLLLRAPDIKSLSGLGPGLVCHPTTMDRLCMFTNLESIDLSNINYIAPFFISSRSIASLKKLDVSWCNVKYADLPTVEPDTLRSTLASFKLEELICTGCWVWFPIFNMIEPSNLTVLKMGKTNIQPNGSLATMIRGATNLQHLEFSFVRCANEDGPCQVQARAANQELIDAVVNAKKLSTLKIWHHIGGSHHGSGCLNLESPLAQMVKSMSGRLVGFSVWEPKLCTEQVAAAVAYVDGLTHLEWDQRSSTASFLNPHLQKWTRLETFHFWSEGPNTRVQLPDSSIAKNLKTLRLVYCSIDTTFADVVQLPRLQELRLSFCVFTDVTPFTLTRDLELKVLDLSHLHVVNDQLGNDGELREVGIDDTFMSGIIKKLPMLRYLAVWNSLPGSEFTNETMEAIASSCRRLRSLSLRYSGDERGVQSIIDACPELKSACIRCTAVDLDALKIEPFRKINLELYS